MLPLNDPDILGRYRKALAEWPYTGYVRFNRLPSDWLFKNFPTIPEKQFSRLMFEHLRGGGTIDQVRETRPEWSHFEYHYDLRFRVGERLLYVETLLMDDDPDDPIIVVVNIHDA